jgi:integral membrane protein (TIGR01906 family)
MPFFNWHYNLTDKNTGLDIAESIGISHDDIRHVTTELLDYMCGKRESLQGITAIVSGNKCTRSLDEDFFTEREIQHMVDVKELYDLLFIMRKVAFFLFIAIVLGIILVNENPFYLLARCSREILVGFLGVAALLAVIISVDFERSWDVFHYIFFSGDDLNLWVLTPYVDLMINMFPLRFFMNIAVFFAVLVLFFSALVIISGSVYLYLNRDRFNRL